MTSRISRREAAARLGTLALGAGALPRRPPDQPGDSTAQPPDNAPASTRGERSPFERPQRSAGGGVSTSPIHELHGTITPSDLHYEVHHSGIPRIDPATYKLLVHGLVGQASAFTLDDLKHFPAKTRTCFIECSGNYPRRAPVTATPQIMAGLMSQSEWTGVPLCHLLREVGVRTEAHWFLAEGADRTRLDRSIPVAKAMDDALLAYDQNGEALRPAQGYPVRLLLPGWEGNTNVKWLRRLEFAADPFMTRWETSRYTDGVPGGKIRQFSFEIDARSIITTPAPPYMIRPAWIDIRGLAWSGRGRISRVEVSVDDGATWQAARRNAPVLPKAQTRFTMPWRWDGRATVIMSRAVDETGHVQPTLAALLAVRGTNTGPYHLNPIVAWRVPGERRMEFRQEEM